MSIDPYSSLRKIDLNELNSEIAVINKLIDARNKDEASVDNVKRYLTTQLNTLTTLSSAIESLSKKDVSMGNSSPTEKVITLANDYLKTHGASAVSPIIHNDMPVHDLRDIMIDYFNITDLLLSSDIIAEEKVKSSINKRGDDEINEFIETLKSLSWDAFDEKLAPSFIAIFKNFADEMQVKSFYKLIESEMKRIKTSTNEAQSPMFKNLTRSLLSTFTPKEKTEFSVFYKTLQE